MKRQRQAGMTLYEITVSFTVTVIILGGMLVILQSSVASTRLTTARSLLDDRASSVVRQLAEELSQARAATMSPADPPLGTDALEFQVATGFAGGSPVWGNTTRIEFQYSPDDPNDGVDNNGNGMIDEGRIVRRDDFGLLSETRTVLVTGVAEFLAGETANNADDNGNLLLDERGLSFERDGAELIIRLTLQGVTSNGVLLQRTVETSVTPRN